MAIPSQVSEVAQDLFGCAYLHQGVAGHYQGTKLIVFQGQLNLEE